jgi:hypothetical protein
MLPALPPSEAIGSENGNSASPFERLCSQTTNLKLRHARISSHREMMDLQALHCTALVHLCYSCVSARATLSPLPYVEGSIQGSALPLKRREVCRVHRRCRQTEHGHGHATQQAFRPLTPTIS